MIVSKIRLLGQKNPACLRLIYTGLPTNMRLKRRLYGFLLFMIPFIVKLAFFLCPKKSHAKTENGRRLNSIKDCHLILR